jgi:hypothetical protein
LVLDLVAIPLARRDPKRELNPLLKIVADLTNGRISPLGARHALGNLMNGRHESREGKFEIDRALKQAITALEDRHERTRPGHGDS